MTLREQIQKRIASMDDAMLPDVIRELDFLEERLNLDFPHEFIEMLNSPKDTNLSDKEAMKIATEAVKAHRRERRR